MFAVLTTGGKQYRVEPGSELTIERIDGDAGSTVTFDRVLLVGEGDDVTVGTPTVDGASVTGTVLGEALGPKLVIFKFKQKVKYRRRTGHRQHLTRVRIDEINGVGTSRAKADKDDAPEKPKRSRAKAAKPVEAATDASVKADDAPAKPKRTRKAAKSDDAPAAEE